MRIRSYSRYVGEVTLIRYPTVFYGAASKIFAEAYHWREVWVVITMIRIDN